MDCQGGLAGKRISRDLQPALQRGDRLQNRDDLGKKAFVYSLTVCIHGHYLTGGPGEADVVLWLVGGALVRGSGLGEPTGTAASVDCRPTLMIHIPPRAKGAHT